MRRKAAPKLLPTALAIFATLLFVTSASAGRAWCRADPVVVIDGNIVDIQVASSPAMYQSAIGPIEMVIRVPKGTRANVILSDFGFGYGYDIKIVKVNSLKTKGALAEVTVRAPAADRSLPVVVYGTRVGTNPSSLLSANLDLLWLGQANGAANEWVKLVVK